MSNAFNFINILSKHDPETHYITELLNFLESLSQTRSLTNVNYMYIVKTISEIPKAFYSAHALKSMSTKGPTLVWQVI